MNILNNLIRLVLLSLLLAGCVNPLKKAANTPRVPTEFQCLFTPQKITLDGKLDEPIWAETDSIPLPFVFSPENPVRISATTARMVWDDEALYISFVCADDDIWSYNLPDGAVWRGDVAEVFIKPSADNLSYYEFQVAPNGAIYDALYPSRGSGKYYRFKGWSSGMQTATQIQGSDGDWHDTDQGYIVEMAIPFRSFPTAPQPAPGTVWTFGAFRYDYSKSFEEPLMLMSLPEADPHGFHDYTKYNRLIFKKEPAQ